MKTLLIALSVLTLAGCQEDRPKPVSEIITCVPYEGSTTIFQFFTSNGNTTTMYIDGIMQKYELVKAVWPNKAAIEKNCVIK